MAGEAKLPVSAFASSTTLSQRRFGRVFYGEPSENVGQDGIWNLPESTKLIVPFNCCHPSGPAFIPTIVPGTLPWARAAVFSFDCRGIPPPAVYPVSLHLSAESGLNALSASIPLSSRHKVGAQKTWGSTFSNRQFSLGIPLLFSAVRSSSHLAQLQAHH